MPWIPRGQRKHSSHRAADSAPAAIAQDRCSTPRTGGLGSFRFVDVLALLVGAWLGTFVMTAFMEAAQAGRFGRMSIPFILGAMVSERRFLQSGWASRFTS